jgi:hypothetical protein
MPSLELAHLTFCFFPIPTVMFLQSGHEDLGTYLQLLDFIIAQPAPSLFDPILQPLEIRWPSAHDAPQIVLGST